MGKFNDLLIEIGVDTSSAKKGIQELDKMFDGLGKSFVGATKKKPPKDPFNIGAERMKMQKYIREMKNLGQETEHYQKQLKGLKNQSQFSAMKKQLDSDKQALLKFKDDVSKENLRDTKANIASQKSLRDTASKAEIKSLEETSAKKKSIDDARVKQATGNITNKLSGKSAKDSGSVFKAEFDRVDKLTAEYDKMFKDKESAEKASHAKDRQRFIDKQQRRAKLRQQRIKDQNKFDADAQNSLQQRLAGYKKEKKAAEAINSARMERQTRADTYEENFRSSRAYRGMDKKHQSGMEGKIRQAKTEFILTGNTRAFKMLSRDAAQFRQELRKLNVVQSGLNDSTRNMIRSYASLFALMEGTNAIKRVGMDFQGMEASMLAATGSEKAAAKDMQFLNGMVDKMGLNLKDTTDAWVKFKFAANGKIDQNQMEDIFTGLSMFGTSLKVDSESMKRSQKAIIQMMSKGKVMAKSSLAL